MKGNQFRFRILALLCIVLLVIAGSYGVYSVSTYGSRWFSNTRNTRYRSAQKTVIPGNIIDRNGIVLATSDKEGNRVYQSDKPSRCSVVHLLGDSEGYVANGVESFQARYLLGFETTLTERVQSLFGGQKRQGDHILLTVDSKLCTEAARAFINHEETHNKAGAVVVMNYKTGEVLAMVSLPIYDPTEITDVVKNSPLHPFWNRALQSTMPPGSTFKIITAAAALDHMPGAETVVFTCTGATKPAGAKSVISDYGGEHHDSIKLPEAFMVSCNNTFAQIALQIGDRNLRQTAESFGFNDNFLFQDMIVENSTYPTKDRTPFEIGWSGVGQSRVTATPMHMCLVAAAVANDGVMMEPRIIAGVKSPMGVERYTFEAKVYRQAMKPETAKVLQGYMRTVVEDRHGTGTKAAIEGVPIAGKTGSAETSVDGRAVTHAWFVGYIDDDRCPYAVCVFVEEGGTGGKVAAPVARDIFAYLVTNYAN